MLYCSKIQTIMENRNLDDDIRNLLEHSIGYSRSSRQCEKLSDLDYLHTHIKRVIGNKYSSGREYIQNLKDDKGSQTIPKTSYFASLQSPRRRNMTSECEQALYKTINLDLQKNGVDHFKKFPELDGYDITSYDGHYKKHACHAPKDGKGHYRAVGGIYGMEMRTGVIQSLITTDFTVSKTHELKAFKKAFSSKSEKTKKMICLVDMAYWDGPYWDEMKDHEKRGMYIITLMRENLSPIKETPVEFNNDHPYNTGIKSKSLVTFKSKAEVTKIVYCDPETGKEYVYLTTLPDIEPGLIAHLYLWRWKIEKVFDVLKNKFGETKAWADGKVATDIQASIIAMAYNILLKNQEITLAKEGIYEIKLSEKQAKGIKNRKEKAERNGRKMNPLSEIPHRMYQMSVQYVRCFQNHLNQKTPWKELIPEFHKAMVSYL